MTSVIKDFLSSVGMEHHLNMFQMRGYDDESDIPHLNVSDLQNIGISDPMEIIIILKAAHSHKESPEYRLLCWLREHGLDHYFEGFVHSGMVLLSDVATLSLPNETLYDELEIILPGHQRRLERAVGSLRKKQRLAEKAEESRVVTEGWWGYPAYLPNAKYPFLCVQATIQSTRQPAPVRSVDFMVDSGSDVSTIREAVIQDLNLEAITTVRSCGAHGSVRTTMYRAYLIIGDSKLEIEIIGSSYDSLGSRVLRHFNHHIDNTGHKWLQASTSPPSLPGNSSGQGSVHSNSHVEHEADTVSVLPDKMRDAVCSNQTAGSNKDESGSGSAGSCSNRGEGGGAVGEETVISPQERDKEDETDSTQSRLNGYFPFSSHSGSDLASSCKIYPSTSSSAMPLMKSPPSSSTDCRPSPVQKSPHRTSSLSQPGHLMISEDGTISLLMGDARQCKRRKTSTD